MPLTGTAGFQNTEQRTYIWCVLEGELPHISSMYLRAVNLSQYDCVATNSIGLRTEVNAELFVLPLLRAKCAHKRERKSERLHTL